MTYGFVISVKNHISDKTLRYRGHKSPCIYCTYGIVSISLLCWYNHTRTQTFFPSRFLNRFHPWCKFSCAKLRKCMGTLTSSSISIYTRYMYNIHVYKAGNCSQCSWHTFLFLSLSHTNTHSSIYHTRPIKNPNIVFLLNVYSECAIALDIIFDI